MNDMTPTQALAALSELCHSRDDRTAFSVIERHVQEMEKALREIERASHNTRTAHGYIGWIARAALPAREKGTE